MSLGWPEILLICLVVFLLFGAGKLPRVMGDFAEGIKAFKRGMREEDDKSSSHSVPPKDNP